MLGFIFMIFFCVCKNHGLLLTCEARRSRHLFCLGAFGGHDCDWPDAAMLLIAVVWFGQNQIGLRDPGKLKLHYDTGLKVGQSRCINGRV